MGGEAVDAETEQGRQHGYVGHHTVVDRPLGAQSEGKESEQRTVGVGTEHINRIDDAG